MEKSVLRKLNFCYYTILVLALIVASLMIYLSKNAKLEYIDAFSKGGQAIQSAVIIYIIATLPIVLFWFKKQCDKLKTLDDEQLKYQTYQKNSLIRLLIVGPGLIFGILFYFLLGGHTPMIWCAAISAIGLIFCKPNAGRIRLELMPDDNIAL